MAFTVTARHSGNSGQSAVETLTTSSATESADSLLLLGSAAQNDVHSAAQDGQTVTGGGLTYTQVTQTDVVGWDGSANFRMRGAVHSAPVGGSPSAHTITIDHYIEGAGGDEGFYCAVAVDVTGHDATDPVAQSAINASSLSAGDSESGSVTLAATPTADNLVVVLFTAGADGAGGFAAPTFGGQSMTQVFNQNSSWTQAGMWYRVVDGTESSNVITCTDLGQSVGQFAAIAVEINADAGGEEASGGSEATVNVTAEGAGSKQADGAAQASVDVTADGSGVSARSGGAAASVDVTAAGAGTSARSGGDDATVAVTADAGGSTARIGASATDVTVTVEGSGVRDTSGGTTTDVTVTASGASTTARSGGSEASVTVTATGGGTPDEPPVTGGSETTVDVTTLGGGAKHASGGSATDVTITAAGAGTTSRTGGTDTTVNVTATGGGTPDEPPVTGGSSATVDVTALGGGVKTGSGGGQASITVTAEGIGVAARSGGSETTVLVTADGESGPVDPNPLRAAWRDRSTHGIHTEHTHGVRRESSQGVYQEG